MPAFGGTENFTNIVEWQKHPNTDPVKTKNNKEDQKKNKEAELFNGISGLVISQQRGKKRKLLLSVDLQHPKSANLAPLGF